VQLARRNARAFAAASVDAVVVNSAGCGAAMRDAAQWLPGEGEVLAASVQDVSELLDAAGLRAPGGRIDASVCYDDPCHLAHGQRVTVLEHYEPGACCGAAGIYNITHPSMARAVLDRKMNSLGAVDPDLIASGNPGCMMQLRAGVRRAGLRARVVHPVELLDAAYRGAAVTES